MGFNDVVSLLELLLLAIGLGLSINQKKEVTAPTTKLLRLLLT